MSPITHTPEQREVIDAPARPLLVVAGAGSGKTQTMAERLVAALARGDVEPDFVLGLTFTRKATAELDARVRKLMASAGISADEGQPTVLTYHSYAQRLVSDYGVLAGIEPDATVLGEAAAYLLAREIVLDDDSDFGDLDVKPPTLISRIVTLSGDMAEHLVDVDMLAGDATAVDRLLDEVCERTRADGGKVSADFSTFVDGQAKRRAIATLLRRFQEEKRRRALVDFGDMLRMAVQIATEHPTVVEQERDRYRFVLLDEYQDTSHAQRVLLRTLFGQQHPVTAVGDPCQSIYGWRGASADNLAAFRSDFPGGPDQLTLSTSFRSGAEICALANDIAARLPTAGLHLPQLAPAPGAAASRIEVNIFQDASDEVAAVADAIAARVTELETDGETPDVAVLLRTRSMLARIHDALVARGVAVDVVGLAGLLHCPEVADVVATLRVIHGVDADDCVVRLVTGPRFRLGAADLAAVGAELRRRVPDQRDDLDPDTYRSAADRVSWADVLGDVAGMPGLSDAARARLSRFAEEIADLRRAVGLPLAELVALIESRLGIPAELASRVDGGVTARHELDQFRQIAGSFVGIDGVVTLGGLLDYLDSAEDNERGLSVDQLPAGSGVKLLTIHAAKGLQFQEVYLPGLSHETHIWPGRSPGIWAGHWHEVPAPLRGDRDALPRLTSARKKDLDAHVDAWREHQRLEELRLFYVAVTRARNRLTLSGSWWDVVAKKTSAKELPALTDALAFATAPSVSFVAEPGEKPDEQGRRREVSWPVVASDTAPVAQVAARVRAASGAMLPAHSPWHDDVVRLLAERADGTQREVSWPTMTATVLGELASDPAALAARLARPMPRPPAPAARRGSLFHAWLENYYGSAALLDADEVPGAADPEDLADLSDLQEVFATSVWSQRTPVAVEAAFETLIGGEYFRGRIDAVFDTDEGVAVLDWKTGRRPQVISQAYVLQLSVYRIAWARIAGCDVTAVRAGLHFVPDNATVFPDLLTEQQIADLLATVPATEL